MFNHKFARLLKAFPLHLVDVHTTGKIGYLKIENWAALTVVNFFAANYFAQKAIDEADLLWDERGYTQDTMTQWLNEHKRTPYTR